MCIRDSSWHDPGDGSSESGPEAKSPASRGKCRQEVESAHDSSAGEREADAPSPGAAASTTEAPSASDK
eukprot:10583105-Alexandrium_andersonii.AAC.1